MIGKVVSKRSWPLSTSRGVRGSSVISNDIHIEVVKLNGEFVWHHHDDVAEAFIVLNGLLRVRFRDHEVDLGPGELIAIPPNVEHMPTSDGGCNVILLEPRSTVSTGNVACERTVPQTDRWSAAP